MNALVASLVLVGKMELITFIHPAKLQLLPEHPAELLPVLLKIIVAIVLRNRTLQLHNLLFLIIIVLVVVLARIRPVIPRSRAPTPRIILALTIHVSHMLCIRCSRLDRRIIRTEVDLVSGGALLTRIFRLPRDRIIAPALQLRDAYITGRIRLRLEQKRRFRVAADLPACHPRILLMSPCLSVALCIRNRRLQRRVVHTDIIPLMRSTIMIVDAVQAVSA